MGVLQTASERSSNVGELLRFFWRRKLWWMIPMIAVLLVAGLLLVTLQPSVIAPFIYTLF